MMRWTELHCDGRNNREMKKRDKCCGWMKEGQKRGRNMREPKADLNNIFIINHVTPSHMLRSMLHTCAPYKSMRESIKEITMNMATNWEKGREKAIKQRKEKKENNESEKGGKEKGKNSSHKCRREPISEIRMNMTTNSEKEKVKESETEESKAKKENEQPSHESVTNTTREEEKIGDIL